MASHQSDIRSPDSAHEKVKTAHRPAGTRDKPLVGWRGSEVPRVWFGAREEGPFAAAPLKAAVFSAPDAARYNLTYLPFGGVEGRPWNLLSCRSWNHFAVERVPRRTSQHEACGA